LAKGGRVGETPLVRMAVRVVGTSVPTGQISGNQRLHMHGGNIRSAEMGGVNRGRTFDKGKNQVLIHPIKGQNQSFGINNKDLDEPSVRKMEGVGLPAQKVKEKNGTYETASPGPWKEERRQSGGALTETRGKKQPESAERGGGGEIVCNQPGGGGGGSMGWGVWGKTTGHRSSKCKCVRHEGGGFMSLERARGGGDSI